MPSLSDIFVRLLLDTEQLKTQLTATQKDFQKFFDSVKRGFELLGVATSVAGIVEYLKRAQEAGIETLKMADRLDTTTQRLQELQFAARETNTSLGSMEYGLRNLNRIFADAAHGSAAATQALKRIGLDAYDSEGRLRNAADSIGDVADGFNKLAAADRSFSQRALFGRGAQDIPLLLKPGSEGLRELADQAENTGQVLDRSMLEELRRTSGAIEAMEHNVENLAQRLMVALGPALQTIAKLAGQAAQGLAQLADQFISADAQASTDELANRIVELKDRVKELTAERDRFNKSWNVGTFAGANELKATADRLAAAQDELKRRTAAEAEARRKPEEAEDPTVTAARYAREAVEVKGLLAVEQARAKAGIEAAAAGSKSAEVALANLAAERTAARQNLEADLQAADKEASLKGKGALQDEQYKKAVAQATANYSKTIAELQGKETAAGIESVKQWSAREAAVDSYNAAIANAAKLSQLPQGSAQALQAQMDIVGQNMRRQLAQLATEAQAIPAGGGEIGRAARAEIQERGLKIVSAATVELIGLQKQLTKVYSDEDLALRQLDLTQQAHVQQLAAIARAGQLPTGVRDYQQEEDDQRHATELFVLGEKAKLDAARQTNSLTDAMQAASDKAIQDRVNADAQRIAKRDADHLQAAKENARQIQDLMTPDTSGAERELTPAEKDRAAAIASGSVALAQYKTQITLIGNEAKNLGIYFDSAGAEIQATTKALADLAAQGITAGDDVDRLKTRLIQLSETRRFLDTIFGGLSTALSGAIQGILQGTQTVTQAFQKMGQDIAAGLIDSVVKQGLDLIKKALEDFLQSEEFKKLIKGIANLVVSIAGAFGGGGGGGGPSADTYGYFQHGGIITRPTLGVIGEAGPEARVPLARAPLGQRYVSFAQQGGIYTRPTLTMLGEHGPEAIVPLSRVGLKSGVPALSMAGAAAAPPMPMPRGPLVEINISNQHPTADVQQQTTFSPTGTEVHDIVIKEVKRAAGNGELEGVLRPYMMRRVPTGR